MCRSRLWLLYCVSTAMRRKPALTRFESAKSTSRKLPPNGTAGLARSSVSGWSRLPSPPASTMANPRGEDMREHYVATESGGIEMGFMDKVKATVKTGAEQAATKAQEEYERIQTRRELSQAYEDLGTKTFELAERGDISHAELSSPVERSRP